MTPQIPAWIDGRLQPADKLAVHRQGLRHKAVSVFVLRESDILLQRRALGKYHTPGLWTNTCCTHPFWDEEPSHCAVRRLQEELGLTGIYPEFRHHLEYRAEVGNGMVEHEEVDVFVAPVHRDIRITPDPEEVMATRWIDYHDLRAELTRHPQRFTPWLRIYLNNHADRIFGPGLGRSMQR
ncbi:isopentenyl-diphosphate Delta-isomerase [Pseudodonghicola flavimaris]|uniref:Isopentenyl-diphosphate Delta-isomerase n=1 Tax=Pseudodonghicola flavimaris TaxID=3050036 RepID=A0ABT7EZK5_9RHOB|nr:isopentenyl-diphosphate Delta-isomerase [Pseudodonghicola flavimaris]MDK3017783.1 isopentenyl-diphosphate Delta-isomerase [Pseudodonghicola flavimaris]